MPSPENSNLNPKPCANGKRSITIRKIHRWKAKTTLERLKIRAKKKLSKLLIPIVKHRLYRFPDGLRIKEVRKSFYQGINK